MRSHFLIKACAPLALATSILLPMQAHSEWVCNNYYGQCWWEQPPQQYWEQPPQQYYQEQPSQQYYPQQYNNSVDPCRFAIDLLSAYKAYQRGCRSPKVVQWAQEALEAVEEAARPIR
ncbi:MAG: hypothetical protein BWK79_09770 [Beggiatoa sp. IS2]|nr:MAG: hypothetical protein BWK79_09770 [Beggiatoa sp. IS2]